MAVKIMWDIWELERLNEKNPNYIALATESIYSRKPVIWISANQTIDGGAQLRRK